MAFTKVGVGVGLVREELGRAVIITGFRGQPWSCESTRIAARTAGRMDGDGVFTRTGN